MTFKICLVNYTSFFTTFKCKKMGNLQFTCIILFP